MKGPNIFFDWLIGTIYMVVFVGGYIGLVLILGSVHILVTMAWFTFFVGVFVGLQIHIIRKLKWFEDNDNQECKEVEE